MSPESIAKGVLTRKEKGLNSQWWKNKKFSTEHCKNISEGKIGYKASKETRDKLSKATKGLNTWSKGRKVSEEARLKSIKGRLGKPRNKSEVYQLDLDGEIIKLWEYPLKAENELKIAHSKINSVCIGDRKTTGGFKWCYKKDYKIMRKIKKIIVMDFDGTLVNTELPDKGKLIYQEKTGKPYPHVGWWGKPESLDIEIFDMPVIENVYLAYEKERLNEETLMVMMTGRMLKLSEHVEVVLKSKGLVHFDKHIFNMGGSTIESKIKSLDKLLIEHKDTIDIEMFDDRLEHIPIFEAWGARQLESGRLTKFKINVVPSTHHGE